MANKNLTNVYKHIERINSEMGGVQKDIAVLKNDIKWMTQEMRTQSKRQWFIVAGILVTVILALSNFIGGG